MATTGPPKGHTRDDLSHTSTTSPSLPPTAAVSLSAGVAPAGCTRPIPDSGVSLTRRDEDWHFTSVAPIAESEFTARCEANGTQHHQRRHCPQTCPP